MISFVSLASGSRANCQLVGLNNEYMLIDCGMSFKKLKAALALFDLEPENIKYILTTHNHGDHISGLPVLLKRTSAQHFNKTSFLPYAPNYLEPFNIISIPGFHDCPLATCYCIFHKGKKISIVTDTGYFDSDMLKPIMDSDLLFIESNYDKNMLFNGDYPEEVKLRISSGYGHLSNEQAAWVARGSRAKLIVAGHLSEKNNKPELVKEAFKDLPLWGIASQNEPTTFFHFSDQEQPSIQSSNHSLESRNENPKNAVLQPPS